MSASAPIRRILLPVMLGSLLGLLVAVVLLCMVWQQQQQAQRRQQTSLLLDGLQQALAQELQRLAQLGEGLAGHLQAQPAAELDLLARQHRLASLRLLPVQALALDLQAAVPINYGVLDLLRRTLREEEAPAEAYRVDAQWLLYAATLQRDSAGQPAAVLLLVMPLAQLLERLPLPDPQLGEWRLLQAYTGDEPQLLLQHGQGEGEVQQWPTRHPGWLLQFRAGPGLQPAIADRLPLALALLASFGGCLLGGWMASRRLHRELSAADDAMLPAPPAISPASPAACRPASRPAASGDEVFDLSDGV